MFFASMLGAIMRFCYSFLHSYGLAIILFTLFTKFILLPMSIWIQKNSIKMVKMQPDINKIKINYFGDKDRIIDEQDKLYKKEKYHALASLIPLFIQIFLLIGVVEVINKPLTNIMQYDNNTISKLEEICLNKHSELNAESSSIQLSVVNDIKSDDYNEYLNVITDGNINDIKSMNLNFLGFDLTWIASERLGITLLIPLIAGLGSLILCICQNKINVLQAEQSKISQYGMLLFSVGLSVYLGTFVPAGVVVYWTASNLLAVMQQWLLNVFINPKNYVDYEELVSTTEELKKMSSNDGVKWTKEQKKKEKDDYNRFFKVINKHLVFYSEGSGFYKYYKGMIEYILENTNITIHYITSDYNDKVFEIEKTNEHFKAYFIGEKRLITLMMKMDADVVAMTMPDLQNYHIKRSYVRNDINYVYIPHGLDSFNLTMRTGSTNHYDTIFVTGKHQKEEMLATDKVYNLKNRKVFEYGYGLLDNMIKNYKPKKDSKKKNILIAPSWQKDNIVDSCLDDILDTLKGSDYFITVRPHPQHVKHMKAKFDQMKEDFKDNNNIKIETDFSSSDSILNADIMITDWSAIAYEYAYTTKRPVIFIDTPMKVMNPEYEKIGVEPFNIWCRDVIGEVVKLDDVKKINKVIDRTLKNSKKYEKEINDLLKNYVYNLGFSDEVGANYIIELIQDKIKERNK